MITGKTYKERWSREGFIPNDRLAHLLWEKKHGLIKSPEPWWKRFFNNWSGHKTDA
jgi:hypothetical protein